MSEPQLFAAEDSAAREWARGLAWLWRLGPLATAPGPGLIGFGASSEAARIESLVAEGVLAGAVIAVADPEAGEGVLPTSRRVAGVARFEPGTRVEGEFTVFGAESGEDEVVAGSSLGAHAVERRGVLFVGHDPDRDWGRLDAFWAPEAVAAYLERRRRKLSKLTGIGMLRLDDTPGIALHQLQGRAKGDRRQSRRIKRSAAAFAAAGAVLNQAVSAEALEGDERVPLDRVWPRSVRALRAGIDRGAFEPVCHGLLHLDTDALARGEVEFREFGRLDAAEAGRRLDKALAWQERHLGRPTSFVAPAWSYGPGGDSAAAERGLVRWYRARPGPLLEDGRLYESLIGELQGIHRLDYSPLRRLAAAGVPPIVAMHGALLDSRMVNLSPRRNPLTLARLLLRRDVSRLIAIDGIRWVGVEEFVGCLAGHAGAPPPPAGDRAVGAL